MILVDHQIREAIEKGLIKLDPLDLDLINPNSIDFRLGEVISTLHSSIIDPLDKTSFHYNSWNLKEDGAFILEPRQFCIASMLENITLAPNIMANVRGKSSLGRTGLMQSSVAGLVDGGWSGILTIEMFNYSNAKMVLRYGMKIGQITFEETATPDKPYGEVGRYQNQRAGMGSLGL